jgi:HrpA-like RNA helicase
MTVATEISYRCKDFGKYEDCLGEIVISRKVYSLMAEKGESLPERCKNCRKKHHLDKGQTKQSYFQPMMNVDPNISRTAFIQAAFTSHGERKRIDQLKVPDFSGMQIRITDDHIKDLYQKLYTNQVVVLASPTGTGKSVYVLYRLLEAPTDYQGDFVKVLIHQGQVVQTQPLTYATSSIPETVSILILGESGATPLGTLGICHRGRDDYSKHNLGFTVTDGKLRNWFRDGHLGQYSLIMVDEAHKRSVNIDNLLTMLQYKLPLYPHLKVIISSATINLEEFKESFLRRGISTDVFDLSLTLKEQINYHVHYWKGKAVSGCDCWICKDETFREKFWSGKDSPPEEAELPLLVATYVVEMLKNIKEGGVLVFLTGQAVIEKTNDILTEKIKRIPELKRIPVLPIYSALGEDEVKRRFNYIQGNKRVLLTTDIAETSHTLSDIIYVIDSGYIKQFQWDPQDMTSTLPTIRHSQAGCRQRFGRVGRTQKGYVYCLYSQQEFDGQFKRQTTPEIFRSPIDETLLTTKAAGMSEEPQFIGNPDDANKFKMEMGRASLAIKDEGYTDEVQNITDDGLDFFRVPLSPEKKALLDAADEQGCLLEMATFLCMTENKDNNPRTGAEAFNPNYGILVWDPRWTAQTKMNVWRIHQALKTGCSDDLDFALKLALCYLEAKKKGYQERWAEQHFLNVEALENIFKEYQDLMDIFLTKAEEREIRELNLAFAPKVRLILKIILRGKRVQIKTLEQKLVYQFPGADDTFGVIAEPCIGQWQEGDQALLISATKKKVIFQGRQNLYSSACSLVRTDFSQELMAKEQFLDQHIFIGSKVSIVDHQDGSYIENIIQEPAQINVEYGEQLDFAMLMDDYLRKGYRPIVNFSQEEVQEKFKVLRTPVKAVWADQRRAKEAKVIGWRIEDNLPCALVVPFDERQVLEQIKTKSKVTVLIKKVFKETHDEKGWVLAQLEGVDFPVDANDLSLAYMNQGLVTLEGKSIELGIKEITRKGILILSNISNIIDELELVRQKISKEGKADFIATVDKIDLNRNLITLFVVNDSSSIFNFQIRLRSIPEALMIGQKIPIVVTLRDDRCYLDYYLEDYQIETLPTFEGWEYLENTERLFFPYFVGQEELKDLDVYDEFKEKIIKNSWNYGFFARLGRA